MSNGYIVSPEGEKSYFKDIEEITYNGEVMKVLHHTDKVRLLSPINLAKVKYAKFYLSPW